MTSDFITLIQEMVLKPDISSAVVIFWFSLVNELAAVLPYVALVSGQLIFLEASGFHTILYKFFIFIAIPAGVGSAFGAMFLYIVAYFGGKPSIDKFGKYIRLSWADVEKATSRFNGHWYDELIFLVIRCIPVFPSMPVNIAVGILRMPPWRYFLLTSIGFTIRMMILFAFMWIGAEALSY